MEEDLANLLSPHENLLQVFFHLLWQKGNGVPAAGSTTTSVSHTLKGVNIPPTITLNHSRPLNWFFTSKDGSILMKSRQKLSSLNVVAEFTGKRPVSGQDGRGGSNGTKDAIPPTSVAAKQRNYLTDFTATLVSTDSSLEEGVTRRTMPKGTFAQALSGTDELLSGTLQAFIEPKSTGNGSCVNNHMIVVNWTPNVMHCEKRTNRLNMLDSSNRHTLEERTTLSESSVYVSTTPVVSSHLIQQLEQLCTKIATHVAEVHQGCKVNNLVLHCKMDANDQIWLLYCSTMRAVKLSKQPGQLPQELALTLVPPRHQSNKSRAAQLASQSSSSATAANGTGTPSQPGLPVTVSPGKRTTDEHSEYTPRKAVPGGAYAGTSFSLSRSHAKLRAARDLARTEQTLHRRCEVEEDDDDEDIREVASAGDSPSALSATVGPPTRSTLPQSDEGEAGSTGHVHGRDAASLLDDGDDEDLGDCSLCHKHLEGEWDATPVQQKHVFFPLQVAAFFNAHKPGTVFVESDGLRQGVVPGHVQLLHPSLTFQEYSDIMQGQYPGAPKAASRRSAALGGVSGKQWFGDQYIVLCQSCSAGLQSMTAGIPIDGDGFIRVPQDNGSSSLKPSRRDRALRKQQDHAEAEEEQLLTQQDDTDDQQQRRSQTPTGNGVKKMVPAERSSSSRSRSRNGTPATQPAVSSRPATRSNVLVYETAGDEPQAVKPTGSRKKGDIHHLYPHNRRTGPLPMEDDDLEYQLRDVSNRSSQRKYPGTAKLGSRGAAAAAAIGGKPPLANRPRPASSF